MIPGILTPITKSSVPAGSLEEADVGSGPVPATWKEVKSLKSKVFRLFIFGGCCGSPGSIPAKSSSFGRRGDKIRVYVHVHHTTDFVKTSLIDNSKKKSPKTDPFMVTKHCHH
jgi:hypothetical protein